jgi:hypothetical protein
LVGADQLWSGEENVVYIHLLFPLAGSMAYSWDLCMQNRSSSFSSSQFFQTNQPNCVHFVQLNNYPTYTRDFDGFLGAKFSIKPSMRWLQQDLNNTQYPVVVNLHDFDTHITQKDKVRAFSQ